MNERNLTFDAHNRGYPDRIKGIRPKSPSHHLSPQLGLDFLFSRCQLNTNPPPLLPAVHYGGNNHQLKSVRPPTLLSLSQFPISTSFVFSLEDAILKALPSLFPNLPETASGPLHEFYNKFQREADEYDRDFLKKYGSDLDTTLIFVSAFLPSTLSAALISIPGE